VLTIFFDSLCPLCTQEMQALRRYDSAGAITLVDLHSEFFREEYPQVSFNEAMRILHAEQGGKILKGLDVTAAAWKAVGKKPWVQCLRWPVIRWFADFAYILFANNRYRLSWLLTGQARCQDGACKIDRPQGASKE